MRGLETGAEPVLGTCRQVAGWQLVFSSILVQDNLSPAPLTAYPPATLSPELRPIAEAVVLRLNISELPKVPEEGRFPGPARSVQVRGPRTA